MKRIGILTAGGDTPALNATIHGAVTRANELKIELYGFVKGFNCFFNSRIPHIHLNPLFQGIPELDPTKGGTLIGSSRDYVDPARRDELDRISTTRPIWVISYAPHFVYLNSPALKHAAVPDNSNVHGVMRYPDGRLNGQFVEIEAGRVALGAMRAELVKRGGAEGMMRMGKIARDAGVTTTAELIFGKGDFDELAAVVVQDQLG